MAEAVENPGHRVRALFERVAQLDQEIVELSEVNQQVSAQAKGEALTLSPEKDHPARGPENGG